MMKLVSVKASRGKEAYLLITIEYKCELHRFKFKKGVSQMSKKEIAEHIQTTDWLKMYEAKILERTPKQIADFGKMVSETLESVRLTLSGASFKCYQVAVQHFLKFLQSHPETDLRAFTQTDYHQFLSSLSVSNNSKRHYSNILKVIFNLMVQENKLPANPFDKKRQPAHDDNRVDPIPESDLHRIWDVLKAENQDVYTLTLLIYYGFIRPKEALLLQIKDIDLKNRHIRISGSRSKTNAHRCVFIPRPLYDHLLTLSLHTRNANERLFKFKDVKQASYTYHKLMNESGLTYYSIYRFKHSGVCEAYKIGLGILEIKDQCGHTKIETTYRYLRGLGANGINRFGVWA